MDFGAGAYLSKAHNPIPPPYTLFTCIQYTFHKGKVGGGSPGELNQREGERVKQLTKLSRKQQHDLLYL